MRANLAGHRDELGRFLTQKEPFKPSESLLRAIDEDLEALDAIYQVNNYIFLDISVN